LEEGRSEDDGEDMERTHVDTAQTSDLFNLRGKVALITGGAVGLGKAMAEVLAEFGADVIIADIDEATARETAKSIERLGRLSLVVKVDVSRPGEVQHMVDEATARFGNIDILINNAGITAKGRRIHEISLEDFDRVIDVNLRGVFICTRAVLPVMLRQKKGNIINMGSSYGLRPFFEISRLKPNSPYVAAKAGVINLTKETAVEYARDGIRANCIIPGWIRGTRLGAAMEAPGNEELLREYDETIARITPMGRKGYPSELKGLIVYLASDASSFVTGQLFVVDGGITL
jgi:NAD(P)-dependent dehydrogenase (short-subunit alcohol dehydrogenase family)